MNQPALDLVPHDYLMGRAYLKLCHNPNDYGALITNGWLKKNPHVWIAFYNATERLRKAGRTVYGAKAVYEHLRYETAVQDNERTFRLNNNSVAGLARLYNAVSGIEFYQTRKS